MIESTRMGVTELCIVVILTQLVLELSQAGDNGPTSRHVDEQFSDSGQRTAKMS
jgi:hypothetical protein